MRTTKYEVLIKFIHLANTCKKPVVLTESEKKLLAKNKYAPEPLKLVEYSTVGAWTLDHNSVYGGWVIEEYCNKSGAIQHPFGSGRMSASEFVNSIFFGLSCIEEYAKRRTYKKRSRK